MSIEGEWLKFLENNDTNNCNSLENDASTDTTNNEAHAVNNSINRLNSNNATDLLKASAIPEKNFTKNCSDIYISTKTKILFLNKSLDIFTTFWLLPITDYNKQEKGIIKKQIKFSFV